MWKLITKRRTFVHKHSRMRTHTSKECLYYWYAIEFRCLLHRIACLCVIRMRICDDEHYQLCMICAHVCYTCEKYPSKLKQDHLLPSGPLPAAVVHTFLEKHLLHRSSSVLANIIAKFPKSIFTINIHLYLWIISNNMKINYEKVFACARRHTKNGTLINNGIHVCMQTITCVASWCKRFLVCRKVPLDCKWTAKRRLFI